LITIVYLTSMVEIKTYRGLLVLGCGVLAYFSGGYCITSIRGVEEVIPISSDARLFLLRCVNNSFRIVGGDLSLYRFFSFEPEENVQFQQRVGDELIFKVDSFLVILDHYGNYISKKPAIGS